MNDNELLKLVEQALTSPEQIAGAQTVIVIQKRPEDYVRLLDQVQRLTDENRSLKAFYSTADNARAENVKLWGLIAEARKALKKAHLDYSFLNIKTLHDYDDPDNFLTSLLADRGYEVTKKSPD